jgi:hypothetical protein
MMGAKRPNAAIAFCPPNPLPTLSRLGGLRSLAAGSPVEELRRAIARVVAALPIEILASLADVVLAAAKQASSSFGSASAFAAAASDDLGASTSGAMRLSDPAISSRILLHSAVELIGTQLPPLPAGANLSTGRGLPIDAIVVCDLTRSEVAAKSARRPRPG